MIDQRYDAAGPLRDHGKTAGDIEDMQADTATLDAIRRRDNVLRHVVRAIRDESQPEGALTAILAALGLALDAAGGVVLRFGVDGPVHGAASWGARPPATALSAVRAGLERDGGVTLARGTAQLAAQAVVYRGKTKGTLLLWRQAARAVFAADEWALLADVADHLGVVLAQVEARERIDHLSRTDHLTGLANRAAFFDEFTRRLSRLDRSRPAAALLYVDVANLRRVNALHGPDAGDAALSALSELLREHTRPGDLIARHGGGRCGRAASAVCRRGRARVQRQCRRGAVRFDAQRNRDATGIVRRRRCSAEKRTGRQAVACLPAGLVPTFDLRRRRRLIRR